MYHYEFFNRIKLSDARALKSYWESHVPRCELDIEPDGRFYQLIHKVPAEQDLPQWALRSLHRKPGQIVIRYQHSYEPY